MFRICQDHVIQLSSYINHIFAIVNIRICKERLAGRDGGKSSVSFAAFVVSIVYSDSLQRGGELHGQRD